MPRIDSDKRKEYEKEWKEKRIKMGICLKCGGTLDTPRPTRYCKECLITVGIYNRVRYARLKLEGKCTKCGEEAIHNVDYSVTLCQSCMDERVRRNKWWRRKLRDEIYSHYGGYRCSCCGETTKVFLTIDHINNNGTQHRKELKISKGGGSVRLYKWLKDNGFPEGFQVLCYNCNSGRFRNGGVCPHKIGEIT